MTRAPVGAVILVLCFGVSPVQAQIVNTLGGWADTTLGWTGKVGASVNVSGGNTDVRSYAGAARAQWQDSRYRARILGSFQLEDANDVRVKEQSLLHLRGVRRLSPTVLPFAFGQVQRNPFTRLKTRWLLGAGLELVVSSGKTWTLSVGASPMLETETIEDSGAGSTTRARLSTFVRTEIPITDRTTWSALGFFQPRLSEPADFRSTLTSTFDVGIVGRLSMLVIGTWEHDDQPPEGVDSDDWDLRFGLTLGL